MRHTSLVSPPWDNRLAFILNDHCHLQALILQTFLAWSCNLSPRTQKVSHKNKGENVMTVEEYENASDVIMKLIEHHENLRRFEPKRKNLKADPVLDATQCGCLLQDLTTARIVTGTRSRIVQ